jgi:hypothetical protein
MKRYTDHQVCDMGSDWGKFWVVRLGFGLLGYRLFALRSGLNRPRV